MYLQLAENSTSDLVKQNYIFVPSNIPGQPGTWVRDDAFDDLSTADFNEVIEAMEPFQPMNENTYLAGFGDWIKKKRELRAARKEAKTELIKSKAAGITAGTFTPGGALSNILGTIGSTASSIFGGGQGQIEPQPQTETESKPFYKNPVVIIGGVLLIGSLIYFRQKKGKK